MLGYSAEAFKLLRSKIGRRIIVLVFIQIFFIVISLVILSYCQSQMIYIGNSINIADNNRFLTSNLMLSAAEYFMENRSDISKINNAIDQLDSNILMLKHGGMISDLELKPLPYEYSNEWNILHKNWIKLKSTLSNNILKQDQITNFFEAGKLSSTSLSSSSLALALPSSSSSSSATTTIAIPPTPIAANNNIKTTLETGALSLVNSSNVLVAKLGEFDKNSSQYSMFLQSLFAVINIGVTTAFIFYIIKKILKPILALTSATSEVKSGNLNVAIKINGNNDELSFLSESFNSMLTAIKNYIKKQYQLEKELQKANEELKYRDQLKDEFINVAAHELKTPLQPIVGLCELLRDMETTMEKDQEIIDIIIRNSKRLMKLAENILNVARIESGSFILKKEIFDIGEMIVDTIKDFEQKILESKKTLKISYLLRNDNNNKIIVDADKNRLNQVICNLLNNALNFTKEGNITVIVERKKENNNRSKEVTVSIKDTGTGIDPEILPLLFKKFATKSLTPGGTGLGLFISKNIIELHDGRIWANNNNDISSDKDEGSTFTFSLPLM
jgi:signal transduction histidine kinase